MKKIVLIGDSIRMGYDKYVKNALENVAQVYYPSENCKFAEYVLRFAHEWKRNGQWPDDINLVHWNAGLWDTLELFGDEPLTSLSYYEQVIARIDKRLRMLFPQAKLVFATSTAILEHKCTADFRRHNATIEEYNKTAIRALSKTDTIINDLYEITKNCPEEYHNNDAVHYYTDAGTDLIGKQVLKVIENTIGIAPMERDAKNFERENYSTKEIGY